MSVKKASGLPSLFTPSFIPPPHRSCQPPPPEKKTKKSRTSRTSPGCGFGRGTECMIENERVEHERQKEQERISKRVHQVTSQTREHTHTRSRDQVHHFQIQLSHSPHHTEAHTPSVLTNTSVIHPIH